MKRAATQPVLTLLLLTLCVPETWAQAPSDQSAAGVPPAATGLDTTTQMSENPPLSGLDQPSFEPGFGTRSYLAPKLELSEAVDSNGLDNFSTATVTESTRALGSLELQKLWKLHPLDVDYIGGVDWYNGANGRVYQVHSLAATQRFLWRTGQFAVRDTFSYLPEGAFGFGSFGGAGAFGAGSLPGLGSGSGTGIFSNSSYGVIGTQVSNMAIADITEYLSPRSSMVLTGGFGLTDFLSTPKSASFCPANVSCYFNSQEVIGQAAYNHQISRHNQIAFVYAYQQLHFPGTSAGSLNVDLVQIEVGHRISGKLDLLLGGGPEWVHRSQPQEEFLGTIPTGLPCTNTSVLLPCVTVKSSFVTGSAQVSLRYRVSALTNFSLTYMRFVSSGSGFFGGAKTDTGRFNINHAFGRHWTGLLDTGFSHNSALLGATSIAAGAATSYSYWYFGGAAHRHLGRHLAVFGSYQYNAFAFGSGGCSASAAGCGASYGRNVLLIGLNWTPQPIRLD
jgi:hypothetical protein